MKRRLVSALLVVLIIFSVWSSAFAHTDDQHYREIESVLFGTKRAIIMGNPEKKKLVRHMEYATALALDQYRGNNNTLLLDLRLYGVPNLPPNVTEIGTGSSINFSESPSNHRQYTHKGWTYVYTGKYSIANWPKRKQIMTETVKRVLNSDDKAICDSLAAILYYVHLLGDMQSDSKKTERDQVIPLIEKHGMSDIFVYKPNKDIFIELYHYLSILFEGRINKTYRSYYTRMMRKLKELYSEAKREMRTNPKDVILANDNNLTHDQLDKYAKSMLKVLSSNMPTLLEHSIFEEVFFH